MPSFVTGRSSASMSTTSAPAARTSTPSRSSGPGMPEWDVIHVVAERRRAGQQEPVGGAPQLVARPRHDHDAVAEAGALDRQRVAGGVRQHADDVGHRGAYRAVVERDEIVARELEP